jgi:hypothetical protein
MLPTGGLDAVGSPDSPVNFSRDVLGDSPEQRCNALSLGVEFFLLFTHQIKSLLSFIFPLRSFFPISKQLATDVRVMCKQNLSGHECCIMPNHISLSDFVLNCVRRLVPFRILLRGLNSDMWLCVPRDFCSVVRPSPARASLARAPMALVPSPCAPSPLVFSPYFNFPAQQPLSLLHLSLSPRGAQGFGDGDRQNLDPRGESLPLLPPLPHPTRPPLVARP